MLPVASLLNLQLPLQHKSTIFANPTEYLSNLPATITTFSVTEIMALPSVVVKALGLVIILDPEAQSIVLALGLYIRRHTAEKWSAFPSGWLQSGHWWRKYAVQKYCGVPLHVNLNSS
ncbi:hypothetical protein C8J57DRAFT_1502589 [Mycena rebaudengoi]|nr:hypothetical protein C8J57DRAFT_1502589 [Mycena rebaudengoi]